MAKTTIKTFKMALENTAGIYSSIAKKLGVDRSAVSKYVANHPELLPFIQQEAEKMIDLAENKLFNKINAGEWLPTQFYLKTKGKNRGYVEKQEIEQVGASVPVKIEIIYDEDTNKTDKETDTSLEEAKRPND